MSIEFLCLFYARKFKWLKKLRFSAKIQISALVKLKKKIVMKKSKIVDLFASEDSVCRRPQFSAAGAILRFSWKLLCFLSFCFGKRLRFMGLHAEETWMIACLQECATVFRSERLELYLAIFWDASLTHIPLPPMCVHINDNKRLKLELSCHASHCFLFDHFPW